MFFKQFRDGWKANALASHLEFAKQRFNPGDLWYVTHHLAEAQKALVSMRQAGAEGALSKVGWEYIAGICAELTLALEACSQTQLAADAKYIFDYAVRKVEEARN